MQRRLTEQIVALLVLAGIFINQRLVFFRYLVDSRWFKQWKKYVGFDSWDKYQMGDQNVYPGPIDNSGLLKGIIFFSEVVNVLSVMNKCPWVY
jgi:hypothetical protein